MTDGYCPYSDTEPDAYPVAHSNTYAKADAAVIIALLLLAMALALFTRRRPTVAVAALTGSAVVTSIMTLAGVPFDMPLWILIDIAVIGVIERAKPGTREQVIVALMVLCWPLYHLHGNGVPWALSAVNIIVAAQFLVTVPWDRLGQHLWTEKRA